uniref:Muscular LMNA interacting protein n=1 Tax=Anser cygnoides TaxID=8845 RepID=A0A8B9E3L4_ANSCY
MESGKNNELLNNSSHVFCVTSQESETKPLTFTFVPSIGLLPTHFEVVDVSKFLVTIPEEPKDLSNQEIINKVELFFSDEQSLKSSVRRDRVPAIHPDSTQTVLQSLGCNPSKGKMQENDLFKAEFILITDSGDEDEAAAASINIQRPSNGYGPISAQLLATSHISPGTETRKPGDGHLPGAGLSHSTADQQKQQTKPGVIRPVLVKAKSAQQKEEPYQPNPFKRYLEEISDQDIEQVSNSHSEGFCSLSCFLQT